MRSAAAPTLADVARAAAVSTATASYALREDGRVRPETRRRVLRAAEALGYRSNRMAAALASRRFRRPESVDSLPLVMIHHSAPEDRHRLWPREMTAFARRRAESLGYHFETLNLHRRKNLDSIFRELHHRGVGGLMIGRIDREIPGLAERLEAFPHVACGGDSGGHLPHLVRVQYDVARSADRAFETALHRGYRRIGAVLIRHDLEAPLGDDLRRLGAVYARMREHAEAEWIEPYFGDILDAASIGRWHEESRPDCVLAFNSLAHHQLTKRGIRIPEDCALVAANLQHDDRATALPVSGYQESKAHLAELAIETLDQRIRYRITGSPAPSHRLIVDPIWHEGTTLPSRGR